MSFLKKNLIANYLGTAWLSILQLLTIPLYLNILGDEAWGLLSIVLTFYVFIAILGSGMSQVLPREISIRNNSSHREQLLDIAYGFERLFLVVGVLFAVAVFGLSDFLVDHWIKLQSVSQNDAILAFKMLSLQLVIQWPIACYNGFLLGLNKHVKLNKIQVVFATIKHAVCIISLLFIENSVFVYQAAFLMMSLFETVYTRKVSWEMFEGDKANCKWNKLEMKKVLGFVTGMTFTVLVGGALVQADKMLLSGLLPISSFGFYSIASVLSMSLLQVVYPMTRSIYPVYSDLIERKQSLVEVNEKLIKILMASLLPLVVFFIVFASDILHIWTGNEKLVSEVSVVLSFLVVGVLINGLYNIPYTLYLASGNSKTPLIINIVSLLCIIVLLPVLFEKFGVLGAACTWAIANLIAATVGWRWLFINNHVKKNSLINFVFAGLAMLVVALILKNMIHGVIGMLLSAVIFGLFSGKVLMTIKIKI